MRFRVEQLSYRYPVQERWAIRDVQLDILPGQITWLTGTLGSGTSTLLLALAGLAPRLTGGTAEGSVVVDGVDIATLSPLQAGIAYLGASPALQLSGIAPTVRDEIAIAPMNLGRTRGEILEQTERAMTTLALLPLAGRDPSALSGGETQRMLVASMLAAAPRAWLLDEPFSALDLESTLGLQRLLRQVARAGASVIITCDDADTMLEIADRIIVLDAGRIVLDGAPADMLAGDAIIASGAGSTDAATLALDAGMPAPRPLRRETLLARLGNVGVREINVAAANRSSKSEPEASVAFECVDLAFSYRAELPPVLTGVDFRVRAGEAVGLFGVNGAGKSTLLRLAMALERPTTGSVATLGVDTRGRHPEDLAPQVGFLFQQPDRQLFATSVRSECELAPRLAGWDSARIASSITRVLAELGLSETAEEHPYDLPLPRRRLVGLATILTAEPRLLLLDEPTAGLDPASRERVIDVIRNACARGTTVLAVTHDAGFAHEALGRGVLLEHGRMTRDGMIREIIDDVTLRKPAALVIAEIMGLPPGRDRRADVATALRLH